MRTVITLGAAALVLAAGAAAQPNPGVNGEIAFERSGSVMAFDPRAGTTRELVAGAQPAWSPKGGLAFVRDGTIYLAAADGTNARALVPGQWPAWSPDGSRLAFVRGGQLFVFDLDQGAETPLTGAGAEIVAPAWSPDGNEVAYGANGAILSVAVDGTQSRDVVTGGASGGPAWSPDATQIAFVGVNGQLYITSRDGSGTKQLTFTLSGATGVAQRPAWSPDGTLVAWAQGPDICVADPTGKVARLTRTPDTPQAVVVSALDWQSTAWPQYMPVAALAGVHDAVSCDRRAGARIDILPGNISPQFAVLRAPADLVFVNHLPTTVIVAFNGHRAAVAPGEPFGFRATSAGDFSFTVTGYPDGVPRRGRLTAEAAGRASIEQHAAIRYGTSTVLTGAAAGVPGEPVVISAKPYGSAQARRIATVQPAGGRWHLSVAPRVTTLYHVSYAGSPVERRLRVKPALHVSRAGNTVSAALTPAAGVRGKRLFLFRLAGRGWTEAASERVSASGRATFRLLAPGRYYVGFAGDAAYWSTASEPFTIR
jgi:TolB protein